MSHRQAEAKVAPEAEKPKAPEIIHPTLGRIVHVTTGRVSRQVTLAAIVSGVNNPGTPSENVDLTVFYPSGSTSGLRGVYYQGTEPVGAESTWAWPPRS